MNRLFLFTIVTASFFWQGCFSVTEEYRFNDDGSGNYLINLQFEEKMADLINTMSALDTTEKGESDDVFGAIDSRVSESMELMKEIDGVKNVSIEMDSINLSIGLKADFEHIDALNAILNVDPDAEKGIKKKAQNYFKLEKKQLTRKNNVKELLESLGADEQDEEIDLKDETTKAFLKMFELKYKIIYHLPEDIREVNLNQNERAEIEIAGNKVTLSFDLIELMDEDADIGHSISFGD